MEESNMRIQVSRRSCFLGDYVGLGLVLAKLACFHEKEHSYKAIIKYI